MLFPFRRQPLKTLYWIYFAFEISATFFFWTFLWLFPPTRPRRSWTLKCTLFTAYIRRLVYAAMRTGPDFTTVSSPTQKSDVLKMGFVWIEPIADEFIPREVAEMAKINNIEKVRVGGYWYGERDGEGIVGKLAGPEEKVLYVLHGGAYVMGSAHPNGYRYPYLTNSLLAASHGLLKRAFALEYRLLRTKPFGPEVNFPAPLLDALAGYQYLVRALGFAPANIILEGDSAGAHLAVGLLRALVQLRSPHLPQLGGTFLISPTPDRAGTHGPPPRGNYASDWLQPLLGHDYVPRALLGALPRSALTGEWLSPASKTIQDPARFFEGFPATLIAAGSAELLILPVRTLRDRISEGSGEDRITYREYEDAMHDWVAFDWCEPQRSQALKDFGKWLEGLYPAGAA